MRRRNYSVEGAQTIASPDDTLMGITASTAVLGCIYDGWIGSGATPADTAILWYMQRYTAAGTSTAYTPPPLDPGNPACSCTAGVDHTVEPTYTAAKILLRVALNLRATHKLNLDPDSPMVIPATASNGIGLYPVHASSTVNVDATLWFYE